MNKKNNGIIELNHQELAASPNEYLDRKTDQWIELLLSVDPEDFKKIKQLHEALYQIGRSEQESLWQLNDRMKQPLHQLLVEAKSGGRVTVLLQQLQKLINKIKPPKRSWLSGFKSMFQLLFSWHESAWHMWLESYPEAQQEINAIKQQLAKLKKQLKRDNRILSHDKNDLASRMVELQGGFDLLVMLGDRLNSKIHELDDLSPEVTEVIEDEFMPPVQQRVIELQQQLLMARQSVMTLDLFVQQNVSQIRGIEQALYTTTSVMDVTAGIVLINKRKANMNSLDSSKKYKVDAVKLKQARLVIDQALSQMDDVQQEISENKTINDSD